MANGILAVSQLEILTQSGTGIVTIVPPATNTNRTLTLPDATGTVVATGTTPSLNGIAFPATQSASADANTLDDYEEGSWTPALNFGGATTGITYSQQYGTYIKIGRMVFVSGRIDLANKGSAVGTADIRGLPFTISVISAGNVGFQRSAAPTNKQVMLTFDTASAGIVRYSDGVTTSQSTNAEFANDTILIFSANFQTTS